MNIAAHVLTGAAILPRNKQNWLDRAIFWSISPDLVWGCIKIPYLIAHNWKLPTDWSDSPIWLYHIYGLGHSLIIWGIVFLIVSLFKKKFYWPLLFWLLHILLDIPGHIKFATPFLFPFSRFHIIGLFSWSDYTVSTISHLIPMVIILLRYRLVLRAKS